MDTQPVLFVSHGSPTLALHPGKIGEAWQQIMQSQPRPDAILVISAHWQTAELRISHAQNPGMLYDFYGFPESLYKIHYAPPGAPQLAEAIAKRLHEHGFVCALEEARGLDHGCWVPLLSMFPQADVPVMQLSLLQSEDTQVHRRIGEALAALSELNILVLCSGGLTHNLRYMGFVGADGPTLPFVTSFRNWMLEHLKSDDREALLGFARQAPEARHNHPTSEHILPLFVALGAASPKARIEVIDLGVQFGMLAMDAIAFYNTTAQ